MNPLAVAALGGPGLIGTLIGAATQDPLTLGFGGSLVAVAMGYAYKEIRAAQRRQDQADDRADTANSRLVDDLKAQLARQTAETLYWRSRALGNPDPPTPEHWKDSPPHGT